MKKTLLTLIVLALFGITKANAQAEGNYQYNKADGNYNYNNMQTFQNTNRNPTSYAGILNNNEVVISVNGLSNLIADNYVATFNLVQVAETVENTDQLMNNRIATFKQKLKGYGIDTTSISVDMVSFVPKYNIQIEDKIFSKTYNEVPAGFEMQKNVSIRYKNSSKLDDIVSAAANSEIYDLVKVDYFVSNFQKSLDSLRLKCLMEIKAKTKSYELIGIKLDTCKKVMADNFNTVYPQSRYFSYTAFSRPSLNAAKKKSSTQPALNEVSKATSKFYNQVNYDQYDIVVNPVITEPVVQISYTVTVKYFVKTEEKQNNIYYIITPSGEIKQFFPK